MKKIKNSVQGVILGIIFLLAGTILIWWNEGNTVKNLKAVDEIQKNVIDIKSDQINPSNDQKLVATNGEVNILDESLKDDTFGIEQKSIKLKRIVEIYQWKETEKKDSNDRTTYQYEKDWETELIDSSEFHKSGYTNPTYQPYNNETFIAQEVKIGQFYLNKEQKENIATPTRLEITESTYLPYGYQIENHYITNAQDIHNPNIGDIRISYVYNDYKNISVLALQNGESFTDYVSSNGVKINRVEEGTLNSNAIINKIISENKMIKWIFRGLGAILVILGYVFILRLITTVTSFIPIIGNIVETGVALVSFLLGCIHSLIIFTIAWIRFRPILGICLLIVTLVLIILLRNYTKKKENNTINNFQKPDNNDQNELTKQNNSMNQMNNTSNENTNKMNENQTFIPQQITNDGNNDLNNKGNLGG